VKSLPAAPSPMVEITNQITPEIPTLVASPDPLAGLGCRVRIFAMLALSDSAALYSDALARWWASRWKGLQGKKKENHNTIAPALLGIEPNII